MGYKAVFVNVKPRDTNCRIEIIPVASLFVSLFCWLGIFFFLRESIVLEAWCCYHSSRVGNVVLLNTVNNNSSVVSSFINQI